MDRYFLYISSEVITYPQYATDDPMLARSTPDQATQTEADIKSHNLPSEDTGSSTYANFDIDIYILTYVVCLKKVLTIMTQTMQHCQSTLS